MTAVNHENYSDEKKPSTKSNSWLIATTIILALILVLNAYEFIDERFVIDEKEVARQEAIENAQTFLDLYNSDILSLMDDYEEAVYDDPNVDSIIQQSFRAQEYSFVALEMMAHQSSIIIDLLATMP